MRGTVQTWMTRGLAALGVLAAVWFTYPWLRGALLEIEETRAARGLRLAGDLGCLMNMAGRLTRQGSKVEVRHVAEVLAGMTQAPAIGDGEAG